jgi:hypothetical protein
VLIRIKLDAVSRLFVEEVRGSCKVDDLLNSLPPVVHHLQVSLNALAPQWAKEKYNVGAKPVKVDLLEYLPLEMEHNYQEITRKMDATREGYQPAAFVTFK